MISIEMNIEYLNEEELSKVPSGQHSPRIHLSDLFLIVRDTFFKADSNTFPQFPQEVFPMGFVFGVDRAIHITIAGSDVGTRTVIAL